ncbi:MAG: DMT family transporter, partial [Bifidobacteriaceae bacterium]|nr:DMT family transporter [Bifidobacteriaceae bacterium]
MPLDSRRLRANLLLLAAAILWGLAFTAQRVGAEHVGAFTFTAVRFAMGAALITAVAGGVDLIRGLSRERRRGLWRQVALPGLVCGSLLTAAAGLQQAAMEHTTAGNAAFVTGLYLVLVPLLGVFLGQRIHWTAVLGIVLAVAGLYLLVVKEAFTIARGEVLLLASALCFAAQILAVGRWGKLPALRFAAAQFWVCAIECAAAAFVFDRRPFGQLGLALWPLLYGGLISVGVAYTFQVFGQRQAEPTQAALIMSLESVFGALGGAILLHESMGPRGLMGAALMALGMVV